MMKKRRIFIVILILTLVLGFNAFAQDPNQELGKIRSKIQILNLLNGLELSKEQMQSILEMAQQAQDIQIKAKEAIAQEEKEITSAYNEVLKVAQRGSLIIPEEIAQRVHRVNQEIDKIKEIAQEELTGLVIKIKDNLKPHQLYTLDNYKPCIIPPANKGRIGQADDPAGFVKALERIRSMPEDRYDLQKEKIAQRAIDKVKAKVPPGFIFDEEELRTKLLRVMDEVYVMQDLDFVIKKEELAKNIKTQLVPKKPALNIGVKIERFLLQSEIIPILEQRLAS